MSWAAADPDALVASRYERLRGVGVFRTLAGE